MADVYRFGPFELDPRAAELRREGAVVPLQPQPAGVLALLVGRAGQLVTREEIQAGIWPDRVVDYEQGLNYAIRQIRTALGDDAETPRYVETLPRRGYRFVAPVQHVTDSTPVREGRSRRVLAYGLAGLLLAAGSVAAWAGLDREAPISVERRTIAVLPFDNLGPDPADLVLAEALTGQIITDLARIDPGRLGVIARTSSALVGAHERPFDRIGMELGAEYLLEGSVQREGETLRIMARLIRVSDGTHIWAEAWDRGFADLLSVQSEIGRRVIEAVAPEVLATWPPGETPLPADPVARESFLVARGLLHGMDRAGLDRARRGFEVALAREPGYAPALTGLGEALLRSGRPGEARAPLERALEIDPGDAQAHHLLAQVLLFHAWEWDDAKRHLDEALRLRPGLAAAYQVQAYWHALNGRLDEARSSMGEALRLDPLSSYVQADAGWIDYWAGDLEAARKRCQRTLELDPESGSGRTCLDFVRIATGEEAAENAAAREVRRLEALPERSAHDAFLLALAYAQLGRKDEAFRELEIARQGRTSWMLWLEVEPRLAPLRDDPRWAGLVDGMVFPRPTAD